MSESSGKSFSCGICRAHCLSRSTVSCASATPSLLSRSAVDVTNHSAFDWPLNKNPFVCSSRAMTKASETELKYRGFTWAVVHESEWNDNDGRSSVARLLVVK